MKFFKNLDGPFVFSISRDRGRTEISEAEYNEILDAIHNRPTPPEGYEYRLRDADLAWVLEALPVIEGEDKEDE